MDLEYWQKQTSDQPLFPVLLWSRPENKALAGKLLIIGGSVSGFSAPAEAYQAALAAGIGTARVILPDSLTKTVASIFPEAEFLARNPSGGFSQTALAEFLAASEWSDGGMLAGDFGKNSETAILLENFASKYKGRLVLAGDSLDYFLASPSALLARSETVLAPNFNQLQKLAASCGIAITSQLGLLQLVERLHEFSQQIQASLIAIAADQIQVAASGGKISSTKSARPASVTKLAASAAVWTIQNPDKTFEALTSAVFDAINP